MDPFKKAKKLTHKQSKEIAAFCGGVALLLLVAGFIAGGGTARIEHSIAVNGISPTSLTAGVFPCSWDNSCPLTPGTYVQSIAPVSQTIAPGQPATIYWDSYACGSLGCAGNCWDLATWGNSMGTDGICSMAANAPVTQAGNMIPTMVVNDPGEARGVGTGQNIYTAYPAVTTTYYLCSSLMERVGYPCLASTVTVAAACPVSSFGSPWNSTSYLIYSGGVGSISNWYGRYCVTNYSGSAIFIPMATPTEWNDFAARAPALNVGIVGY